MADQADYCFCCAPRYFSPPGPRWSSRDASRRACGAYALVPQNTVSGNHSGSQTVFRREVSQQARSQEAPTTGSERIGYTNNIVETRVWTRDEDRQHESFNQNGCDVEITYGGSATWTRETYVNVWEDGEVVGELRTSLVEVTWSGLDWTSVARRWTYEDGEPTMTMDETRTGTGWSFTSPIFNGSLPRHTGSSGGSWQSESVYKINDLTISFSDPQPPDSLYLAAAAAAANQEWSGSSYPLIGTSMNNPPLDGSVVSAHVTQARLRWSIPTNFEGAWMRIEWTEKLVHNDTSSGLNDVWMPGGTQRSAEWSGPGNPADPESWYTAWSEPRSVPLDALPHPLPRTVRIGIANIRWKVRHSDRWRYVSSPGDDEDWGQP